MLNTLAFYFVLFIIYSFMGWCMEMMVCYYASKKWVNRGFLIGPVCPIYGYGCLIITILLKRYLGDPIVLFVMAVVLCCILEYFTSYLMEKSFKARWWDYSNRKFNLNGRICLENAVLFGVLGLLLSYIINPFVVRMLGFVPTMVFNIFAIILLIVFLVDNIISLKIISGFTKVAKTIRKDSTEEITKKVKEILVKQGYLYKRLVSAFNFQASEKLINDIKSKIKHETLKAKRLINAGIDLTTQTKDKIVEEYKEKVAELKAKIKIEKEIKKEKLKKIK